MKVIYPEIKRDVAFIKTTYDISLDFGIYCYQEDSVRKDPTGLGRLQGAYLPSQARRIGPEGLLTTRNPRFPGNNMEGKAVNNIRINMDYELSPGKYMK